MTNPLWEGVYSNRSFKFLHNWKGRVYIYLKAVFLKGDSYLDITLFKTNVKSIKKNFMFWITPQPYHKGMGGGEWQKIIVIMKICKAIVNHVHAMDLQPFLLFSNETLV